MSDWERVLRDRDARYWQWMAEGRYHHARLLFNNAISDKEISPRIKQKLLRRKRARQMHLNVD